MRSVLLTILLTACASAPPSADLGDIERRWIDALIRADRATIAALRAPEYVSDVRIRSGETIPAWAAGEVARPGTAKWSENRHEIVSMSVLENGDTAVVTTTQRYLPTTPPLMAQSTSALQHNQKEATLYRIEDHWIRREGRWQIVKRVVEPQRDDAPVTSTP